MRLTTLTKANIFVGIILLIVSLSLSGIYYYSFFKDSMESFRQDSMLKMSYIYSRLSPFFIQPVSVSKAMAKDVLLVSFLSYDNSSENFENIITNYLKGYKDIYDFDGAFLTTLNNNNFYTQDGFITTIKNEDKNHEWYNKTRSHNDEYDINIDIDKTLSAHKDISLFVNYKIYDFSKKFIGIVGICVHLNKIMNTISHFEKDYNAKVVLVDAHGNIQLSGESTAFSNINWVGSIGNKNLPEMLDTLKNNYDSSKNDEFVYQDPESRWVITVRYIPQLSWFLVVECSTQNLFAAFRNEIIQSALVIFAAMAVLMVFISKTIHKFEDKIKSIYAERNKYFHDATRYMFHSIYEIDITGDRFAPDNRLHQFEGIEIGERSYSESLAILAQHGVKKEFRESFLDALSRENILREYEKGNEHIVFDCLASRGGGYQWLRYDAHIFSMDDSRNVHIYLYAKNIDAEVKKEIQARTDTLTGCLTRGALEHDATACLVTRPDRLYSFFIFDIDNFKQANDKFGHTFGDYCIKRFAAGIKSQFRDDDLVGRIGGDEFVAFIPGVDAVWVRDKAATLVRSLDMDCELDGVCMHISASVGIALYPSDGTDYATLYRNADAALYAAKASGKNDFRFFDAASMCALETPAAS